MNPWYVELVIECEAAHDKECEHGEECPERASHIEQVFIRHALIDRVVTLQARLAAVKEVHERREYWTETGEDICDTCSRRKQNDFEYWPCDTIKAVRGE